MTAGSYKGVADRLIREFAEDPALVRDVLNAEDLPGILTALAESLVVTADPSVEIQPSQAAKAAVPSNHKNNVVERRQTALTEIMQFFELREVRGRALVVRRHGEGGLCIEYRRADGAAAA